MCTIFIFHRLIVVLFALKKGLTPENLHAFASIVQLKLAFLFVLSNNLKWRLCLFLFVFNRLVCLQLILSKSLFYMCNFHYSSIKNKQTNNNNKTATTTENTIIVIVCVCFCCGSSVLCFKSGFALFLIQHMLLQLILHL